MKRFIYTVIVAIVCIAFDCVCVPIIANGGTGFIDIKIVYLIGGNLMFAGFGWALYILDKY